MELTELLTRAEALLAPYAVETARPEARRLDVIIREPDLKAAVKALEDAHWGYLATITGLDLPSAVEGVEGQIEGLYHFCEGAAVVTLRVRVPYSAPRLQTICDLIPSATLYEREFIEMFGVTIEGTPSNERLLLADSWPEEIYPLRKAYIVPAPGESA